MLTAAFNAGLFLIYLVVGQSVLYRMHCIKANTLKIPLE